MHDADYSDFQFSIGQSLASIDKTFYKELLRALPQDQGEKSSTKKIKVVLSTDFAESSITHDLFIRVLKGNNNCELFQQEEAKPQVQTIYFENFWQNLSSTCAVLKQQMKNRLRSKHLMIAKKNYRRALKSASSKMLLLNRALKKELRDDANKVYIERLNSIAQVENQSLQSEKVIDILQLFKKELKKCFDLKELVLIKEQDVIDDSDEAQIFPLVVKSNDERLVKVVFKNSLTEQKLKDFSLCLIIQSLESTLDRISYLNEQSADPEFWSSIITKVDYPFVLFSDSGEALVHNSQFSNLRISYQDCLELQNSQQVHINDRYFKVFKTPLISSSEQYQYLVFSTDEEQIKIEESEKISDELGIVTSSVAHEINNPLAGILAAIEYLFLLEINEDEQNLLIEMKKSARRCQALIQTFLGFSRANLQKGETLPIAEALEQALNLLRSRMVEMNLMINIEIHESEYGPLLVNRSIFSMIFYLIFNEVLTNFSHFELLAGINSSSNNIQGHFLLAKDHSTLKFEQDIDIETLQKSKLLRHLLKMNGHKMQISQGTVEFKGV